MIPIQPLGFSFVFMLLCSCVGSKSHSYFSDVKAVNIKNYNKDFRDYCNKDSTQNFASNAVASSFFGEYNNSIAFATKKVASDKYSQSQTQVSEADRTQIKIHFESILNNPASSEKDKLHAHQMLNLVNPNLNLKEVFQDKKKKKAKDFIVEKAKHFHFVLINEAHYSTQNRAFTRSLLQPLWEQGYRYLAMEALEYKDTALAKRGYPIYDTGYYIQDSEFGNLVREALAIGYQLVAYETTGDSNGTIYDGTLRDRDQARNIYQNTWQKDSIGKVLIHAGYGHISEVEGGSYIPMGLQLKELLHQDILTVDQIEMTEVLEVQNAHPYYQYAISNFEFQEPVVFVDTSNQALRTPLFSIPIDIQVYHPLTTYVKSRPFWLLNKNSKLIDLPERFNQYRTFLLEARRKNEQASAVPLDKIIIEAGKALLLPPGEYELKIVDREGTLRAVSALVVN